MKEGSRKRRPGVPVYVDDREPVIRDPARRRDLAAWVAVNNITIKLSKCVESVRDITRILKMIAQATDPLGDRRGAKLIVTPLFSLAEGVEEIYAELRRNPDRGSIIPAPQREAILERSSRFLRIIPKHKGGELRNVRNKIGAHVDTDAVVDPTRLWRSVDLAKYLAWTSICCEDILWLLEMDIFAWSRDDDEPISDGLMTSDGVLLRFCIKDGHPTEIADVTIVRSPKYAVAGEVRRLMHVCEGLASKVAGR